MKEHHPIPGLNIISVERRAVLKVLRKNGISIRTYCRIPKWAIILITWSTSPQGLMRRAILDNVKD